MGGTDHGAHGAGCEGPQGPDGGGACCDGAVVWNAYERMAVRLRRAAYRVCGDCHEAEDVVHDTMLAAHGSVHRLRDVARLEPWLVRIAKNHAATTARRRRRFRVDDRILSEDPEESAGLPRVAARFGSSEPPADAVAALRAALDEAPPAWRDAFRGRIVQGLSYAEIAGVQGVSVACVKTRVSRVRRRLLESVTDTL